ncbi:hypothetical protein OG568_52720 (plasmid) [Streptomyces sp. NBC_01450]|uniref:hypothetical protein n=1 Tax=Streptomyces sp. NBC_01450 TaxID=2903871 RepID=UPI002E30F798|nr:hypothetical protein [Streptomyces sp. NBC_01450]
MGVAASELGLYDFTSRAAKRHRSELGDLTGWHENEDEVESVLSDIKAHPGNVSLNSLLDEISKLGQVRAVGVPEKVFAGIDVQVVNAWRARASASSPSHLRCFDSPVRHVLLAGLLFQRQREITDILVELLNSTVHRINARAEKKVTEVFVAEFTKVRGKSGLLGSIAAASLGAPEGSVRDVIYPAAGGEKPLKDLSVTRLVDMGERSDKLMPRSASGRARAQTRQKGVMKRQVSYQWRLRERMAAAGVALGLLSIVAPRGG